MTNGLEIEKLKLEHLQSVISRVEGNTFQVKALCITLVSAAIAFSAANSPSAIVVLGASFGILLIFWALDASYLETGRRLRSDYNALFQIVSNDVSGIRSEHPGYWRTFFSWSVLWFYMSVGALIIASMTYLSPQLPIRG